MFQEITTTTLRGKVCSAVDAMRAFALGGYFARKTILFGDENVHVLQLVDNHGPSA